MNLSSSLKDAVNRSGRLACWAIVLLLLPSLVDAQQRSFPFTLRSATDSVIALADNFPDFSTLRIQVDSSFYLSPRDFSIDTANRRIIIGLESRTLLFPLNATPGVTHKLDLSYYALPLSLKTSYSRSELEAPKLSDSLRALLDTSKAHGVEQIAQTAPETDRGDILSNFQKSGSISRGFQLGSNRDLGLTSGFNLQFSGDVARDVNITGALTEEQTPIQPEGTTQTLNEIDKVFIRIKAGEHFTSTLGDFYLDLNSPTDPTHWGDHAIQYQSPAPMGITSGPEDAFKVFNQSTFEVISRKLIGAEATAQFDQGALTIAGASPRGQFTTNTFQGQEAYQGPYRLTGKNGERAIIIVAGTEHVYVDGALQTRGEKNDYIIDYALGEITFQPRRLITNDSRITIDFQYSDQQYSRSLFATNGKAELLDGAIQVSATYLREGDNQDAPLDLTISDSDRAILSRAGANPANASKSAVTYAGVNASGIAQGSYVRADTAIGGTHAIYYRYAPLDSINALYNVSFGYAGQNKGAYTRLAIGQFQYVGPGLGDYDTLAFLALPQLHQVMAVSSNLRLTHSLGITGEFASSSLDPNRFAAIPSITGNAYRFGALFADTLPILGRTEFRAVQRNIGSQFTPVDRIQDVEFERRYGNDNLQPISIGGITPATSELSREATVVLRPLSALRLEGGYGSLNESTLEFSSERAFGIAELIEDSTFVPHALFSIERMPTQDSSTHEQALWNRLSAEVAKTVRLSSNALTLGMRYGEESKHTTPFELPQLPSDSLTLHSFAYRTAGPFATLQLWNRITLTGQYDIRTEDSARNGTLARISQANTSRFTLGLLNLGGFSSNVDLTVRDKHYSDSTSFVQNGGNQSTLLLRFEPRYSSPTRGLDAQALYEISNQRAAQLERIFLPVPAGLGAYYYLGDLNHNGKADPNEFAPARYSDQADYILLSLPTEQLFPTTNLRSTFRLHLQPRELFGLQKPTTWVESALGNISSESYLRLEETSSDPNPNDIYFFRLSHFRNDSTTINGLMEVGQDFNILENDPNESYRLHYLERQSASQYNTGLEHVYQAERSIRGRFRPWQEVSNETTLLATIDRSTSDTLSVNRPHNTSSLDGTTEWSYHPLGSRFDYGAKIELSNAIEHSFSPELSAFADAVTLRSSYALETRARLRAELERDELTLFQTPSDFLILPYALTQGRSLGITWLWRLALDYQFGAGIVATLSYDGRNEAGDVFGTAGERVTIHNARAEVRANF